MKRVSLLILCLLLVLFLTGCVKTYTYQVEREDQELRGNRGVIMGEAPELALDRKPTRTMLGIDVALPPSEEYKAQRRELEEELEREEPLAREVAGEAVLRVEPKKELREFITRKEEVKKERPPQEITYTIQKGDTLEKIAKKYLGRASKWTEIYNANKGVITSPSKIYPGQVIIIPQTIEEEEYK